MPPEKRGERLDTSAWRVARGVCERQGHRIVERERQLGEERQEPYCAQCGLKLTEIRES